MPGNPRVLVAGGGIGGLTAALALLRMGCDVEVCEQAAELREVGAGLQLAANGTRALYALGIGEELKALSCEAESKEIRIWNSGERWKLHDLGKVSVERYGYPYLTVYRPDCSACSSAQCGARSPAPSGSERSASGLNKRKNRSPCGWKMARQSRQMP